eukprot:CAMPEP_0181193024 /NCGR_PEP_ID=MMETSP1096-20121128/13597_1 /TAXON_ID=156174 ORGANISM="Chrysochromulina ericina, Strain CCMP281" /NCGR_SAMPLE_ID=MMETSP1096 /ASSEMBLY_ACC=CAM_ASM_000453 /LENGTH=76 /DNA_ID=CAMNT_0023282461 /DNA_START=35 /DNA_END=265 /DNA_ORIENTATION=+
MGRGMGSIFNFTHFMRTSMEQEPAIVLSCALGFIGFMLPVLAGDGGRAAEEQATNYAFRIKHVYPPAHVRGGEEEE